MAVYSAQQQQQAKRQKTAAAAASLRDRANLPPADNDFFPGLTKVEYRPDGGADDTLCYRYYCATERVHGRPMEEWLRPAISFWQAFHCPPYASGCGWKEPNFPRPWNDGTNTVDSYKRRLKAAFELYSKLGLKHWCVWDRDLAPEGVTLDETNHHLDECVEYVGELQHRSGVRPLWVAANLHYSNRYINGAMTSSEAQVISYAGAQIKKALEIAHKLGAENFLFRGVREGYSSTLNTDHPRQLRNYARLLKMAADYKERLGFRGQLLFEPNYEDFYNLDANGARYSGEQRNYFQYDYDTPSAVCFLKQYGLDRHFKISSKPGHQLTLASVVSIVEATMEFTTQKYAEMHYVYGFCNGNALASQREYHSRYPDRRVPSPQVFSRYGMLGSVDATFITSPPPLEDMTLLMKAVIENGGLQPGGVNLGVRPRPDSPDARDLAVAYVAAVDALGRALRAASKAVTDGAFAKNLQQRYLSFHSGFGSRFVNGEASLEECEEHARKQNGEATPASGRTDHWRAVFGRYAADAADSP